MSEQQPSPPSDSLEDPDVPAQDSAVPDPTAARQDPGTADAIADATDAAKADIAATLEQSDAGEQPAAQDGQEDEEG
jgi:hypothetical protein